MSIIIEHEYQKKHPKRNESFITSKDLEYKSKVIINDSTSKAMYSFPSAKRFSTFSLDNSTFLYNIPGTLSKRATSIGYGKKSNILFPRMGKTDTIYNIPNEFDAKRRDGTPKYTFGMGRDICRKPKCLDEGKTPGPGNYFPYKSFGQNGAPLYSMSFRYKYKKDPDNYPGPGTYEYQQINKKGIYSSSFMRNTSSNKFSKAKRFLKHEWNYPGPGTYNRDLIRKNGYYYNSRYVNNAGRTMGKKLKLITDHLVTPGPGAYEFFSEFQGFNRDNFVKIRINYNHKKLNNCRSTISLKSISNINSIL